MAGPPPSSGAIEYRRFSVPGVEFTLEYPRGWRIVDQLAEREPSVGFLLPTNDPQRLTVLVMVQQYKRDERAAPLEEMMGELSELAERGQARVLEARAMDVEGNPGRLAALSRVWSVPLRHDGIEIHEFAVVERYLFIEHAGLLYVVSYVAREDLDAQFASVFEHAIKTFHFLPAREGGHP